MSPRDLRGLVPPEPMEIILDAVDAAAAGSQMQYLLPHFPQPLIPYLQQRGVFYDSEMLPDYSGVVLTLTMP